MFTTARFPLLVVAATLFLPPARAAVVTLQNPTATYSQTGFLVAEALTGGTTGWAVLANPATAAFESANDVGHAGGTALTLVLDHQSYNLHNLGRFRLSVTTDDRSTFCDGLPNGGDVTANWTVLLPTAMVSGGGATFTRPSDGVMVVTGTNPARDTYTITALTNLTGITGVRLETFRDDSDPTTRGPGRSSSHNFVLTNFTLSEAAYAGPPRWNADADGNWSNVANWVGGVPNAAGAVAEFHSAITAARTVAVDSPATVGTIHFENANAYTIAGPSALILQGSAGAAAINVAGGSHTISAPLVLSDPTAVAASGGSSLGVIGGIDGVGGLSKQGAGTLVVNQASYGGATVIEQGTLRLLNNPPPGSPLAGGTVWFDAADAGTLTVDGSNNVTEWRSKVGANNLAGVNPSTITYHTSGGGPNSQAHVRTAGSSYFDFDSDISDARTLFMVFKPTANPTAYTPFFGLNPESSPATGGNYMGTAEAGVGYVENTYSAPGLRTTGATPAQWFLDGAAFNPTTEPLSLTDYRVISVAAGANVRVENIGRDRGLANRSLAAHIGEIVIYSNVLSDADRQAVEAYLLNKWLGVVQTGYGNGSLPASTALQIGSAGTFDLNGNHQTVASLADHGGAGGTVTNSHGTPAVLTIDAAAGSSTFTGSIADGTGGVSLVKSGDSTQVLAGPGVSTYTGGTIINGGVLEVRRGAGSGSRGGLGAGPIVISAGALRLSSDDYNALGAGTGRVPVTIEAGGTLTADNSANNAHNLGLLTLNGGTLTSINGPAGPANDGVYGNFILNAGVTTGGASMSTINATAVSLRNTGGIFNVANVNGGTDLLVLSRVINHPGLAGALTKTGAGTLELAGANTYTGGTTVNAGTLLVSNTAGSGTGTGAVNVHAGATLAGTGRIGSHVNVNSSGSLAPATSVGTLYLDGGNLTFDQNAFFDVDIDSVDLADLVQMDGGLLSPNEATIRVNLGFSPELGDSWTILQGEGSRDSDFNTQVLAPSGGELLGWMWFDVSYDNSVILTVVPEPGTGLLLLAAAAFGMMVRRRS